VIFALVAILLAGKPAKKPVAPVELQRTETERAGSAPFDLVPNNTAKAEVAACRLEETLPMGQGVAEKRSCQGRLDPESARRRCKDMTRHNALPQGVTGDNCVAEYQRGHFLFAGELKEVIVCRRRDGARVAAFEILEGDLLATFQSVGDAVLVGVGGGDRVHYAVVSARGLSRAPQLGEEAVDVEVAHGRIRVTGKAHAMQVDLIPQNGELKVERK
jgi:hypothetical protein